MQLAPILAAWGPPFTAMTWRPVTTGFSGSLVFNGEDRFSLKGITSPLSGSEAYFHLGDLRDYQAEAQAVLDFIPAVIRPIGYWPLNYGEKRYWQIDEWRPGSPLNESADASDIQAACAALAKLHQVWSRHRREDIGLPAATRRLKLFSEFDASMKVTQPWQQIRNWLQNVESKLNPWLSQPVITHPCLCDVHREHILFEHRKVSGIIDFAAMKFDHPAVDLARYLGEFPHAIETGVRAYHAAGGSRAVTLELVTLLAVSGDLGAAAFWRMLPHRGEPAGQERLARVERRLQHWNANGFFDAVS